MAADTTLKGHCLCGACTFELRGAPNWVGYCHCDSCRRAVSSPYTAWIGQENGRWTLTGPVQSYASSKGRERGFCSTCGSQLYYRSFEYPTENHFYVALLDDPEAVTPTAVYHADEQLSWVVMPEGLKHGSPYSP